ncbi:DUF3060 domain-containing protein [Propionibacterium australiense]|uniref:DUF3060 domain-containing protein n=1 Tax=Propionibacterium australiense TaxID=119981 RepID=A0A383S9G1_9ACTN|nr:DUF3060 domain-containing protein [Propionibacterium australiense]RLP06899.1 DUF3060 domain-containing protein [Propionibacterium australiense]RLP08830.1 DUF3060 domain-containing protein [Propionibacterium australiense]SYZ34361.1 Protein of unknown function (DUF3060) [Propionibacterium australiense]VEH90046.1 Protein of uncharacterised function (DUF3060) [Propionibacterium australiense]
MNPMNHGRKLILVVAGATSAILLASGCSFSVNDSSTPTTTTQPASVSSTTADPSASSAAPASTAAAPNTQASTGTTDVADPDDDITDPEWLEAIANSQKTIAATPTTTISGSDQVITVRGDCDVLMISGSDNTIIAEDATRIDISGSGNKVFVEETSTVTIGGSDNMIVWDDGTEPTVQESGSDNIVRRAR